MKTENNAHKHRQKTEHTSFERGTLFVCFLLVFFSYGIALEDNTKKTGYIKCKPISSLVGKN